VAIHAAVRGATAESDCNSGAVWTPSSGRVVRLQDVPCGKRASQLQYDRLTLAGARVAWTDYDFGNHAYCTGPYLATLARPKPHDTGGCPPEPDNGDLYWEYRGDGGLLVARSYTLCEADCPPDYSRTYDSGVTIWSLSTGLRKLVAAKDDTKLLDVDAGRILLRDPAGKAAVLNASGRTLAVVAGVQSAWLAGASRVVAPSGTTLRTYDAATGAPGRTYTLKAGAKVQDAEPDAVVYLTPGEVRLLSLSTGRDRVVARQKGLVQADLEPAGLFYAYNAPGGGSKPGRVAFVPASGLPE
jgi:hypothetical protein